MDFDNMGITPSLYQDIGSSCFSQPFAPMAPMYYSGSYGIAPMQRGLPNDKFERLQKKEKESKSHAKKVALGILGGAAALLLLRKIPVKAIGKSIKSCVDYISAWTKYGFTKLGELINKIPKPPMPPTP